MALLDAHLFRVDLIQPAALIELIDEFAQPNRVALRCEPERPLPFNCPGLRFNCGGENGCGCTFQE